ncbi:MAG: DUF308 domain-containing protein [Rikenellaceae bacterium]|nr:DUF308 domain-containing protein [Rikenellaceae bacterium]MDE7355782.1 DUF308 domain-containing protein [Rikenellaceae bacterium]
MSTIQEKSKKLKIRSRVSVYGRGILAILIGLSAASFPIFIQERLFQLIGVIFIFGGIIASVGYFRQKSDDNRSQRRVVSSIPFTALVSIIAGIIMLVKYRFMLDMTMFILGAMLILLGLGQFLMIFAVRRSNNLSKWLMMIPVLVILCGVFICFNPFAVRTSLFIFFGFVSIFYGVTDLVILIAFKNPKTEPVTEQTADQPATTEQTKTSLPDKQ